VYEFLDYRVCDAMTADPIGIAPQASIAETEALLEQHDFNALPVVGAKGELLGVVTKLDLLRAFRFTEDHMFPPYEQVMAQPVRSVMTADAVTVTPRTPLTRVLETLVRTRSKSLPVVEDGRVVGIIAREDVLAALRRAVGGERPKQPL
jgi:CBS-domain-containing membrane protein